MPHQLPIPSVPDPISLIEATSHFVIQILIVHYPELLEPPEAERRPGQRPVLHARVLLKALEDLQLAVEEYRSGLPWVFYDADGNPVDDIPF